MQSTSEFAKQLVKVVSPEPQDAEAIRERVRLKCRKSLYFLAKAVLGYPDLTPHFHRALAYQIQDPGRLRKLLEIPRGHLKTTLATRSFPIWRWIQEPDPPTFWGPEEVMLLAMSAAPVASVQIRGIQGHFEMNTFFKWLFPELIPDFRNTIWNLTEMRIGGTKRPESSLSVGGVDTKMTGMHYTGILEDDLVDETIANSEIEIGRRISWHQLAFPLLEVPGRDWIHTIGNRWGRKDVNGWIKENEPDCDIMTKAAILPDGTPLWPERFSLNELAKLRIRLGPSHFACQYMNDPRDMEGAAFSSKWLRYYSLGKDERGADVIFMDDGEIVPLADLWLYMVIDPALSPGNKSDRTAVVVTGVDPKGRIFVLEARAIRKDPHAALLEAYEVYNKWKPPQVAIEDVLFQRLLMPILERMARDRGQWLPVRPVKGSQSAGAKEARINQVVGETFASGRTFIRKEMTDFVDEYSWFPDPTTTRDLLDAYALSDKLWTFRRTGGKPLETADQWLRAALRAGMNPRTGY